ncbi:MAG: 50S ribosomal protein L15 [Rhodospirillales bacterium]|nr:50S ribosomal protein L15 [Rhodospirillales bacterium]
MRLNEIRDNSGATRPRKRVGRGMASGTGKTSAKGMKGQKSRSGVSLLGFEGGQMPLYRRLPKRGFNNIFAKKYSVVNLSAVQKFIDAGKLDSSKPVDAEALREAGLFKRIRDGVRLLGTGELKAKLDIKVSGASKSAIAAVEKAGGTVTLLAPVKSEAKAEGKSKKASQEES